MLSGWGGHVGARRGAPRRGSSSRSRAAPCSRRGLGRSYGDSSLPARPATSSSARASPTASSPSTRRPACCAPRPASRSPSSTALFLPRGCFPPVTPGTQVRHARRHGRRRRARQEPPRGRLLRRARARRCACASPTAASSSAARRVEPRSLLGHRRRHGPDRPHPRGRVPARAHRRRPGSVSRERARCPTSTPSSTALDSAAKSWPMTDGLDRLPAARAQHGPRHPDRRALGEPRQRRRRHAAAPSRTIRRCRSMLPSWAVNPVTAKLFNSVIYWKHARARRTTASSSRRVVLLPARRRAALEPRCTAGAASRSTSACCPRAAGRGARCARSSSADAARRRSSLCVIKDCGPEGRGMLSFPLPGISIALDMPVAPDTQRSSTRSTRS